MIAALVVIWLLGWVGLTVLAAKEGPGETVLVFLIIGPMWLILVVPFLIYWLANLGND